MADDESPEVQRLSLLDEDGEVQENMEPPQRKRRSFWQRLLRKKSADDDDDDKGPKEDDALLGSGLENYNDYNDDDPAALDGSQRSRLTTSYRSTSSNHGGNSSDDDDDDDDNLQPHSIRAGTGMDEYDNLNFLLLSSGDDEEEDEGGDDRQMLQNYYRSAPNLNYNSNVVTYTDDDDDDDSSGSDDGSEDSDDDDDDGNQIKNLDPLPAPRRPGLGQRSYSMSSGFSDRPTNEDTFIDPNGRKQLVGRIEGFGNANKVPPELTSPRSFRERLRSFTSRSGGMKKMAIGYGDDNNNASSLSLSWTESLENNVNDIVDAIVPDPVLEGYIDHSEPRPPPPTKKKKSPAPAAAASTVTRLGSFRRQEFDNDETYILFLECELQNTELELASWKRRVTELEREVANLRGDDTDDDSSKSDASADGDEAESEIEWQSEPVVEGVLIDVDGSESNATEVTTNDTAKLAQTKESPNNKNDDESEIEWQTEPLKEGVLIDVEGAEESVSHSIVCEESSNARNISKEANIVVNGESHGDGQESDEEEDDSASSDEEEEDGISPAEGVLIDIAESESTAPIGAHSENDEADHEVKVGLLLDMDGDASASQDHPLPADGSGEANLLGLPDVPAVVAGTELNSVTHSILTGDLNINESNDGETAESGSDSSSEDTDEEDDEDEEEDDSDNVSTEEVKEGILIDIHDGHEDKTNSSSIHSPTKETLIPVVSDEEGQQSTSDDDGDDEVADEDNSTAVVPEGDLLDLGGVSPPAIGISG